jgi:glycosyltransferase involved in cell wall biosynthesis
MNSNLELSVVLPCLNEAQGLRSCLRELRETLEIMAVEAEVIVADNGSTDGSISIVKELQKNWPELSLVFESQLGYGSACRRGFDAAKGRYIFMADADGSYDLRALPLFIRKLRAGSDLVLGDRFAGGVDDRAMPWLHRYLGNPVLSFLVRWLFRVRIADLHCGARAMARTAFRRLIFRAGGMEFASEMVVKAAKAGMKIEEVPIRYRPRLGESKLRSWSDGWRHLRFILLYSPLLLFFLPGLLIFGAGLALFVWFYVASPEFFGLSFYGHPFFLFSLMMLAGYQLVLFGGFSKVYAVTHLGDRDDTIERLFRHLTIEKTGGLGILLAIIGAVVYAWIFIGWLRSDFGPLSETKNAILGLTLMVFGLQTFFAAFMFSMLGIKEK